MLIQDITKLIEDSKFFKELTESEDDFENLDINDFIPEEVFRMLDLFYNDYTQFNEEESYQMLDILALYGFRQTEDFAVLTIVKFGLVEFPKAYTNENLFQYFPKGKEVRGKFNAKEKKIFKRPIESEMKVCLNLKHFLAFRWMISQNEEKFYDDFSVFIQIACEKGNLESLEFLYEFYDSLNLEKKWKITDEISNSFATKSWKWQLECVKNVYEHVSMNAETLEDAYLKFIKNARLDCIKWMTKFLIPEEINFALISEDRHIEILEFLFQNNIASIEDLYYIFEDSEYKSLNLMKWIYETIGRDNQAVVNAFSELVDNSPKIDIEIYKWLFEILQVIQPEEIPISLGLIKACEENNLLAAKFFYDIYIENPDNSIDIIELFNKAFENDNYEIAKFLYDNSIENLEFTVNIDYKNIIKVKMLENMGIIEKTDQLKEIKDLEQLEEIKKLATKGKLIPIQILVEKKIIFGTSYALRQIAINEYFGTIEYLDNVGYLDKIKLKTFESMLSPHDENFIRFFNEKMAKQEEKLRELFHENCRENSLENIEYICNFDCITNEHIEYEYIKALKNKNFVLVDKLKKFKQN